MIRKKAEREKSKVEKRVAKLPTPDLVSWAEQALYGIGRSLSSWQRAPEQHEWLEEARMGAEALNAVMAEISSRQKARA